MTRRIVPTNLKTDSWKGGHECDSRWSLKFMVMVCEHQIYLFLRDCLAFRFKLQLALHISPKVIIRTLIECSDEIKQPFMHLFV